MVCGLPAQSCRHVLASLKRSLAWKVSLLPPCIPHSDWLLTLPISQWILACSVPLTLTRTIAYYCPYLMTLVEPFSFSGFTFTFINEGIDLVNVSDFSGPSHSIWQDFHFGMRVGGSYETLEFITIPLSGTGCMNGPEAVGLQQVNTWLLGSSSNMFTLDLQPKISQVLHTYQRQCTPSLNLRQASIGVLVVKGLLTSLSWFLPLWDIWEQGCLGLFA